MNKLPTPPKRIFDPGFVYVPAAQTDLRKTFERVRAEISKPQDKRIRRVR